MPPLTRPRTAGSPRRAVALALTGLLAATLAPSLPAGPAAAVQVAHDRVVSANPADITPRVLDGTISSIVTAGDTVIVAGTFTQVQTADGLLTLPRTRVFSFNHRTGAIDTRFAPVVDGEVNALALAPDGTSVFLGGAFSRVNGTAARNLARVQLVDGGLVESFRTPAMDGQVFDLELARGRLYVAGEWHNIAGVYRPGLAALRPDTGALHPSLRVTIAGARRNAQLGVRKIDVSADGSRLVMIGSFAKVSGAVRHQLAVLDLTRWPAQVSKWATGRYEPYCIDIFGSYVRDIDISPDGRYFVVVSVGGAEYPKLCDAAARFELRTSGLQLQPTWVDYTGGDALLSVGVTGEAVYVGGHQRWFNNPYGVENAGAGTVARKGIAALDPLNGLPLSWNPGHDRGVGVRELVGTGEGLYVGSDTNNTGGEYHPRLAFFPLLGGAAVPPVNAGVLPGDVHLVGATGNGAPGTDVRARYFTGSSTGSGRTVGGMGVNWRYARGAVMLNGQLYTGWSDGKLYARSFSGSSVGPRRAVNLYRGRFGGEVAKLTGLAYDGGRFYYTISGQRALYYRYFTRESEIVGAERFTATGNTGAVDWTQVSGMFASGGNLYYASKANGRLFRVGLANGRVSGTPTAVSGPGIDGVDWRAKGLFLRAN